jgi:O-antigen/teichoic acid export membrane protein
VKLKVPPSLKEPIRIGWALLTRGAGSLMKFAMSLLVARTLGTEGAGLFFLFIAWGNLLGVLASIGLPSYTLRTVSVLEDSARGNPVSQRFVAAALRIGLLAGITMVVVVVLFSRFLAYLFLSSTEFAYIIATAGLAGLFLIILKILTEALTGRGEIIKAMQLENVVAPLVVVIFLSVSLFAGNQIDPQAAISAYLAGMLLALLLARWFWVRRGPGSSRQVAPGGKAPELSAREMASFWGVGAAGVVANNVAIIALPLFASPAEVGLFGIANRMATMSVTILDALANIFNPAFARRYAHRDATGLRRELFQSQVYSVLAYIPVVLLFLFFAEPLLGVVGSDFVAARQFLMILLVGQLINCATGLAGGLLNMSHRQYLTTYVLVGQALLTVCLVAVLGANFGGPGVAIAFATAVGVRNLLLYVLARNGINQDARLWSTEQPTPIAQGL